MRMGIPQAEVHQFASRRRAQLKHPTEALLLPFISLRMSKLSGRNQILRYLVYRFFPATVGVA